jgi:alpha-2-macroglobulin
LEHPARRRLTVRLLLLLALLYPTALLAARPVSFNLSTNRSFAPSEKPTIHLYAQNVDALEFRIYHVQNPAKFLAGLPDLHSFDNGTPFGPKEQIDERTWLEKFHDWKHHLWFLVRRFFRSQFTVENRDRLRAHQASLARRSRIVGVAQFAQIPLLNDRQLVARWTQELPPTYVSDSQELPIDPLPSGLYLIEATDGHYKAYTLLMVSRMAMITRTGSGSVLAYCVDRVSGVGIAGVKVSAGFGQQQQATGTTDADGLAPLQLAVPKPQPDNFWVVASSGDDVAAVTPGGYALSGWQGGRWSSYVYTDRPVYRPGHVVHWKGILRARVENHLELPKLTTIHVTIADQDDHPLLDKDMPLSAAGNVSGDLTLPATATLGYYTLRLRNGPASDDPDADAGNGQFRVEDYRKPEYQVRVSPGKPRQLQGESVQVVIDARYFFGEPVSNAKVKYRVYHSPHYWWDEEGGDDTADAGADAGSDNGSLGYDASQQSEQTGKLDANGKLTINVPTQYVADPSRSPARRADWMDQDYTVEAAVTDQANREISGRGRFLATRGSFRIHVEPVSYAVRVGESALFNVTAVDYDNHPVQTRVHLQLVTHKFVNGATQTTRGAATDVTTDASGRAQATIPASTAGSIEVEATATTPESRVVFDSSYLWVMGGNEEGWGGESRSVQIVADKKSYAPGETAHLSILSNVDSFHPLVIATGYTVEFRKVMFSPGKSLTFDLPITTDAQPNLEVTAAFIRNDQLYQANLSIKVPPVQEQLQIDITPDKQVFQPQQTAGYDVFARDWQGKPVSSDFSFGVVDEAIYSLYPDSSGDMVKKLYPDRYVFAAVDSSLQYYFSGKAGLKSPQLAERASRYRPQLAQVKPGNDVVQPRVRKAFPDTAYWSPSVHTDAAGHAHVTLTFPDSLTTWRTTVHAITLDSRAGSAINRVLVRKNIIVRMGTPRFLRQGDEVTIPVIVHNYLDQAKQVQLSLDINGVDPVSGAPQSVNVPSKGEGTALWRVKASRIGTAKLLAKALTNEESDALELTFPVEPIGVPRTINTSGVITQDQPGNTTIDFPANSDAAAHTLHLEVAPSIAGSLFSALGYLTSYPYGCTEQTMSSFLPNLVVADTLKKFNLSGLVSPADLQAKINAGLDRLNDLKHDDGGWGWWKEDNSRVFMTAYVVSGLAQAKSAGYAKADANLGGGVAYLQKQLAQHPRMLPELRAYVVYALSEAGAQNLGPSVETLWARRSELSAEGLALTGMVMLRTADSRAPQIAQLLEAKARHTGTLVSWPSSYNPLLDLNDDNSAESTAFALRFLTHADAESPLLEGAAQWLVLNRNGGYWWNSTEQTAMVIFGLADYLAAFRELNADFDVDVLLNGASIGKRHFTSADAVSGADLSLDVAAAQLHPGSNVVQVTKHGSGRAYWSVQGKYYSTEQKLYQQGTLSLNLTRDYFKLVPTTKDGQIVYRLDPLKGPVAIGDTLAVHLAVNGSPTKYLLIQDPIPAGTEFVQQADGYKIIDQPDTWQYWYTRSEFYDDRAAFFATESSGRHESFYLLKVVNPGSFAISPANVQPMYQPGIQATSDLLHLQVEETK